MTAAVPTHAADVQQVEIDGDVLLFDGEMLHRLTGTGAAVWQRVDGVTSREEISDALAREFAAPVEVVAADVEALCAELAAQGLLLLADPAPGARYVRPGHVGYVRDGDHVLIGDLRSGARQALSPSGARVWELACASTSPDDVAATLQHEHPEAGVTAAQVEDLLDHLCAAGLLQRRDGPAQ